MDRPDTFSMWFSAKNINFKGGRLVCCAGPPSLIWSISVWFWIQKTSGQGSFVSDRLYLLFFSQISMFVSFQAPFTSLFLNFLDGNCSRFRSSHLPKWWLSRSKVHVRRFKITTLSGFTELRIAFVKSDSDSLSYLIMFASDRAGLDQDVLNLDLYRIVGS